MNARTETFTFSHLLFLNMLLNPGSISLTMSVLCVFLASCDPSHTSCGNIFKECNSIPCALAHLENYSIPCSHMTENSKAKFRAALLLVLVSYLGVPAYESDHSSFLQQYLQSPGVARSSLHQTLAIDSLVSFSKCFLES